MIKLLSVVTMAKKIFSKKDKPRDPVVRRVVVFCLVGIAIYFMIAPESAALHVNAIAASMPVWLQSIILEVLNSA